MDFHRCLDKDLHHHLLLVVLKYELTLLADCAVINPRGVTVVPAPASVTAKAVVAVRSFSRKSLRWYLRFGGFTAR